MTSLQDDRNIRRAVRMLGLRPDFTKEDLRRAYLRGARKLAPDKGGDERKFIALQDAYSLLKQYARRREVDVDTYLAERAEPSSLAAAPEKGKRHKDVNSAYAALYGSDSPSLQGRGEWLRQEVPQNERPPERVSEARLNETFEAFNKARGRGPLAVSTHVVQPMFASSTVGYSIDDSCDDYTIGTLPDLQLAYGGAM